MYMPLVKQHLHTVSCLSCGIARRLRVPLQTDYSVTRHQSIRHKAELIFSLSLIFLLLAPGAFPGLPTKAGFVREDTAVRWFASIILAEIKKQTSNKPIKQQQQQNHQQINKQQQLPAPCKLRKRLYCGIFIE